MKVNELIKLEKKHGNNFRIVNVQQDISLLIPAGFAILEPREYSQYDDMICERKDRHYYDAQGKIVSREFVAKVLLMGDK